MKRIVQRVACAALAVHAISNAALAQEPARLTGEDAGVLTWGIAAALVVIVCITAFINPKRSHRA